MKTKINKKEEGAVMMIVVLLLMIVTASGVYAVHATTSELRGSGATKNAYQAEIAASSITEAAIDLTNRIGPGNLYRRAMNNSALNLSGVENPSSLASGMIGTRLYETDINNNLPINVIGPDSLNNGVPQTIQGVVDVYDMYRFTGSIAGNRSDGQGHLSYLKATYTGRTRVSLPSLEGNSVSPQEIREQQTTTSTTRLIATSGPFNF